MVLRLVNIKARGREIILFARDESGKKHKILIDDFYPYYYTTSPPKSEDVIKVEKGYKTNKGVSVYKVYVTHPSVVPKLRDEDSYEADIPYVRRFMIDVGLKAYFEFPIGKSTSYKDIRVC